MKDLVCIPANFRPEFLHVCLEHILAADGGKDKIIWVSQDRHATDLVEKHNLLTEVRAVVEGFNRSLRFNYIRYIERSPHSFTGNPYNFLELYKEAYAQQDVRCVYLIEDDVIVGRDFFRWHEAVHERFGYELLCSVGWHCTRNKNVKPTTDPNALIQSARDFTSIGVCWNRQALQYLVPHARTEYYRDLSGYIKAVMPANPIPHHKWTEQAGLIMRVLLEQKGRKFVMWPGQRRCSHIGMSGYHRRNGFQFSGRLDDKIRQLKQVIGSTKAMRALSPELYDDIDELPLMQEWKPEDLRIVQKIPYDGSYE